MGTSQFTPGEALSILSPTYRSIDVRVAAVRDEESWWNSFTIIRLAHLPLDVARERARVTSGTFPRLETTNFRIESETLPATDLDTILAEASEGFLHVAGVKVGLRQKLDLASIRPNYLALTGQTALPLDGERWPGIEFGHGQSVPHYLHDPIKHREVSILGFESPYEAIASICQANVWPSSSHSFELYLWVPVFAALDGARISPNDRCLTVRMRTITNANGLHLSATVTPYGGMGQIRRFHTPVRTSPVSDGSLEIVEASLPLESYDIYDRIEMRLSHTSLGEIDRLGLFAHELLPRAHVNPLLESLKRFCDESEFEKLLIHPWSAANTTRGLKNKAREAEAFEEHVAWLFNILGFSALRLGAHERLRVPESEFQRGSVDILAANNEQTILLVVGCTMGAPNTQDFTNILNASAALHREVFNGTTVKLLPILVTAALGCPPTFQGSAETVVIVDSDHLRKILQLITCGQQKQAIACLLDGDRAAYR